MIPHLLPRPFVCVRCGERLSCPHEILYDHSGRIWVYVTCPKCGERNVFRTKILR